MGDVVAMSFVYTLWLTDIVLCTSFDIKVLSFDIELVKDEHKPNPLLLRIQSNDTSKTSTTNMRNTTSITSSTHVHKRKKKDQKKKMKGREMKMKATAEKRQCPFQYPEEKQAQFILSNMMNELTLVFVKAHNWLREKISRSSHSTSNTKYIQQELKNRFNTTHNKQRVFFEKIYHDMIKEYRKFYTMTMEPVLRTAYNACQHQTEVRRLWHDLLERCLVTVKKAVRHCVHDYLADLKISPESNLGRHFHHHVLDEMNELRLNLLIPLCDKYEICYDDELKQFASKEHFRQNVYQKLRSLDDLNTDRRVIAEHRS